MAGQHYCLRWNNYQSNMTSVFHHLLRTEAFVDVTLACNNDSLKAHKVVLSACSSYFQKILLDNPSQHPTIIMPADVCFTDLKFIIEFVYRGEIDVSQAELQSLLKTADQLKIKGLCEVPEGTDTKDMPGAEVTPLPPRPASPPQLPPSTISAAARAHKFRRLTVQAKRRLDTKRRLYRENPQQKQQVEELPQVHQTQTIHQPQQQMLQNHQSHQLQHQTQQNLHQNQQTNHNVHHQQNIHQQTLHQQNIHQTQQNMHQTQQNMHQTQQSIHQTQNTQTQVHQMNTHQQNVHIVQQQTLHQTQQSMHQTTQQHLQTQHMTQNHTHQESAQQTQMIQAVVTTVHDPSNQHNQISSESLANCITVATSTDDDLKNVSGVVILESRVGGHGGHLPPHHTDAIMMTSPPPIMSTHALPSTQQVLLESSGLSVHSDVDSLTADVGTQNTSPTSSSLLASPQHHQEMTVLTPVEGRVTVDTSPLSQGHDGEDVKVKFETLRAMEQTDALDMDAHMSAAERQENGEESVEHTMHTMMITPELLGLMPSNTPGHQAEVSDCPKRDATTSKTWTQEDMDAALEALRNHTMSLTKASITFGIPSTTLWQRAHRLGIDTPKKDGPAKSWTEDVLNVALEALRNGSISANKASKAYGIPSSTLYKIARREGIRLAAPFNAAPTTWTPEHLERALEAIRSGQTTVQRAAADFGIPSGTLYGRCKREGIELSRSNPTPWSEDAMTEALEAVRLGQMSINQAAIHYNLPYSSLYGRFKRVKYEADHPSAGENEELPLVTHHSLPGQIMLVQYQQPTLYQHTPS
ncbi:longitudinals lacking protein, isoforms J/P/Q/S/Z-like isoform X2 [Macrosteles quadrilineatus]|uniref:longitudinals lacking protein, isoforms J/P/Q/S/Z-like isoform X2 n=1 Tax=Macrosteles quadrilineatus TaxID=74068 RepID=UPI0023E1A9C4|nr:longitudinals lacking protein, isoforms J/P/Q/S/Z-like isoform X2 [Macrosteles quadrilineatus]